MTQNVFEAINRRDGKALARMIGPEQDHQVDKAEGVVNATAERLVDALFNQLKQVFPAAEQTNLRSQAHETAAKRQWIAAFAEAGIQTKEQLSAGMRNARAIGSPFWPSPGQFIKWCREGHGALGISSADVIAEYWRWRKEIFQYACSEDFPWKKPVMYHICLELRRRGTEGQLSEKELSREATDLLVMWEKRSAEGKPIPPIRRALAKPDAPRGPTPAEMLMAEYRRRKENGMV